MAEPAVPTLTSLCDRSRCCTAMTSTSSSTWSSHAAASSSSAAAVQGEGQGTGSFTAVPVGTTPYSTPRTPTTNTYMCWLRAAQRACACCGRHRVPRMRTAACGIYVLLAVRGQQSRVYMCWLFPAPVRMGPLTSPSPDMHLLLLMMQC